MVTEKLSCAIRHDRLSAHGRLSRRHMNRTNTTRVATANDRLF